MEALPSLSTATSFQRITPLSTLPESPTCSNPPLAHTGLALDVSQVLSADRRATQGGQSLSVNGTERCPVFGKIRCPIFCTDCVKSRRQPVNWLQVPHGVWYHASWHISLVKTGPSFCFCPMLWTTTWGRTTRSVSLMHSQAASTLRRLDSSGFGPTTRAVQATTPGIF